MKIITTKYTEFVNEGHNGMHPKSNLDVGTFLVNYYHGKDKPKAGTIYRIHKVGHSDYSAFEISHHDSNQMSRSIDDSEIIGTDAFKESGKNEYKNWCFEVIDESFVKNLIIDEKLDDVIDYLANRPVSISGVEDDAQYDYYKNLPLKDLSNKYVVSKGGALETLVRIYDRDGDNILYDPLMDFPGAFGGFKPVKF